jgi:hypothetical protein
MHFNKKLKSLRDKKVSLVAEVNKAIDRLEQIQFILNQNNIDEIMERPQLKLEEIPEKY